MAIVATLVLVLSLMLSATVTFLGFFMAHLLTQSWGGVTGS